jgi:hypothetical protein
MIPMLTARGSVTVIDVTGLLNSDHAFEYDFEYDDDFNILSRGVIICVSIRYYLSLSKIL